MRTLDSSRDKKQERKIKTNQKERQKERHSEGKELFYRLGPKNVLFPKRLCTELYFLFVRFHSICVALPIKACTDKIVSGSLQNIYSLYFKYNSFFFFVGFNPISHKELGSKLFQVQRFFD
jgi:hypothetical protein